MRCQRRTTVDFPQGGICLFWFQIRTENLETLPPIMSVLRNGDLMSSGIARPFDEVKNCL